MKPRMNRRRSDAAVLTPFPAACLGRVWRWGLGWVRRLSNAVPAPLFPPLPPTPPHTPMISILILTYGALMHLACLAVLLCALSTPR